ncbi:hypothetical protein V1389_15305 [Flavobacterium rakeshii]|uniref:hypothetical protein n=1 Tax=Flavobacterium rakeshii TaxID=1038845 RepID=UPI002E7C51CA|nr:hypothetical protein [Flavobacterium rakeshii]MEE1899713.1 hypothetical protein [Flavobacterium rakeshii]
MTSNLQIYFVQITGIISLFFLHSCKPAISNNESDSIEPEKNTTELPADTMGIVKPTLGDQNNKNYSTLTTSKESAEKIKTFLHQKYLEDFDILKPADRKFSFFQTDFNNDGKDDYFVHLYGSYFCNAEGCTYLLLDNNLNEIAVLNNLYSPIYRSDKTTNGWNDIILFSPDILKDEQQYIKIAFKNGKYTYSPANAEKLDSIPSQNCIVMWDNKVSVKEFSF